MNYVVVFLIAGIVGTFLFVEGVSIGRIKERQRWGLPVGDGKVDDFEAVRRLINGPRCIPPGTYKIGNEDTKPPSDADFEATQRRIRDRLSIKEW